MVLANKRVLLTGHSGFIGSHLCRELNNRGAEVLTLTDEKNNLVDVRDWSGVNAVGSRMGKVDLVYHLAALMFVPASFDNPREMLEVNILGTLNILELCRLYGIEKIVFVSSYIYGPPQYLPVDEKHPLNPTNPYARSKLIGENLCRAFHEDYGLKCVILRPFNVYGEGQVGSFLLPSILEQAAGGKIELMDPEPKRDFLYITDMIEAFIRAGEYNAADYDVFNIGRGSSCRVDEIARGILAVWGSTIDITYRHQRRRNEIMDVVADIKKAKLELGWVPKVGIKEGLRRYVEWYQAQLKNNPL